MGFFSSLKNMVTGGGATVTVEVTKAMIGRPCNVNVNIAVKDDDIKASNVYMKLKCDVKDNEFTIANAKNEKEGEKGPIEVSKSERFTSVYLYEDKIAGETIYNKGGNYTISKETRLPADKQASSEGKVIWSVYAGIDMKGNDPDSGWQRFDVTSVDNVVNNLIEGGQLGNSDLTGIRWGTKSPLCIMDKDGVRVDVRMMGTFDLVITDPVKITAEYGRDFPKEMLHEQMRSILMMHVSDEIAELASKGKIAEGLTISSARIADNAAKKIRSGFSLSFFTINEIELLN